MTTAHASWGARLLSALVLVGGVIAAQPAAADVRIGSVASSVQTSGAAPNAATLAQIAAAVQHALDERARKEKQQTGQRPL